MLYFSRFDISEGIDDNKTSASKESFSCHYWYFFFLRFNSIFWNQQYKVVDYCCVIF